MAIPITIVTPSFNQGRFIDRTIQSVLSQEIAGLEFLVFDGGSRDETVTILKRYEGCLQWVSEKDRGQTHAVNKGLTASRGEVIGWLNSDDIYYPGAVQLVIEYFENHPDVDVVYGDAFHIDEQDEIMEAYYTEPWNLDRLAEVCFICQPATFFRRRTVEQFGLLDESLHYCMDYEYWLRLGLGGARFAYLPTPLAGSRMYRDNKTLGAKVKVHREMNDMLRKRFRRVPDRWLFNYGHAVLDTRGLPRSYRFRFSSAVSALSIGAALYWNHRVSIDMLRTTIRWVGGSAKATLKEAFSR